MATDVSSDLIRSTQESLGKFVKKPPLSEKLLKKPPFRFLHDIITAVNKSTGFFEGLFTVEELNSENVKDRESKIAFLQKVVEVVNIVTESSLTVRPSKIIAGLEPEKTNELLQALGLALQQNLNSKEAIEAVTSSKPLKKLAKTSSISKEDVKSVKKNPEKPSKPPKKDETKSKGASKQDNSKSKLNQPQTHQKLPKDKSKSDTNKQLQKLKTTDLEKKVKSEISPKAKPANDVIKAEESIELNEPAIDLDEQIAIPRLDGFGKMVELKDIIDDSDEAHDTNSVTTEVIHKPNIDSHVPTEDNTEVKPVDTTSHETRENKSARPQSRISRQRSSLSSAKAEIKPITSDPVELRKNPENGLSIDNLIQSDVNTENHQNLSEKKTSNHKENSLDSIEIVNVTSNGTGDLKPRSVRTSSSRKSAKKKIEPLKATQSISIESRSDQDITEHKSISSESENKDYSIHKTSLRPPSVRPSSARPGAPRLRERNSDVILTPSEPVVVGKVHVIVENYDHPAEDDEGSVEVIQIAMDDVINNENDGSKVENIASGHGHLVQQILETQKELASDDVSKVEIEWEYGARREREAAIREIESIRSGLQSLSRASNPLGKLMDYIQEDVEVMRQELLHWREARFSAAAELKLQQSLTEQQIQPLEAKLKQLDDRIAEQTELLYTVKSNIHRNAQKIIQIVDGDD